MKLLPNTKPSIEDKVKAYLKNLGLDMNEYNGFFTTDIMIYAKIDNTMVHISHDFDRHSVFVYPSKKKRLI